MLEHFHSQHTRQKIHKNCTNISASTDRQCSAVGRQPAKLPVVTGHTLFTEWGISYTTAYNRVCTTETWGSIRNASIKIEEYEQWRQQQLHRGVHEFPRLDMEGFRLPQSTPFRRPPDKKAVNARIHSKRFSSLKSDVRTTEWTGTNDNLNRNWNFLGRGKLVVTFTAQKTRNFKLYSDSLSTLK